VIQFTLETDKALFEKSMRFAQKQVKRLIDTNPGFYPMYTKDGKWKHDGPAWTRWCDGFLPGMMWLFRRFEAETGGKDPEYWYKKAVDYTKPLVPGGPGSEVGGNRGGGRQDAGAALPR
jgi:unsaturated chondroitin disaccharide hydrolase